MNSFLKKNSTYFIGISLLIAIAAVFLMQINKGDESVFFSQHRSTFADFFFRVGSYLGEPYIGIAVCMAFLFYQYRYVVSIGILIALVGLSAFLLKYFFRQPRPITYFKKVLYQPEKLNLVLDATEMNEGWTTSFPSGHTMSAFALYGFLALAAPWHRVKALCLLLATWVGLSRIYLLQHFLEDVMAGMAMGTLIALLVYGFNDWLGGQTWAVKSLHHRRTA